MIHLARAGMYAISFALCTFGGSAMVVRDRAVRERPDGARGNGALALAAASWAAAILVAVAASSLEREDTATWVAAGCAMALGLALCPRKSAVVNSAIAAGLMVALVLLGG